MSVRRLADDQIQPARFAFNRGNTAAAKKWIAKYPKGRQASAVIPLLMIAQEQDGGRKANQHAADDVLVDEHAAVAAEGTAAMIDGLWLQSALLGGLPDHAHARRLLEAFVDSQITLYGPKQ